MGLCSNLPWNATHSFRGLTNKAREIDSEQYEWQWSIVSAVIKSLIVAVIGLLFAVLLGMQLGQSSLMLPVAVASACAGTFIYVAFFRTVRFEALIIGLLLFGYIVANRGFAQLTLRQGTFFYIGEVGMVACAFLLLIRAALTRERPIPNTNLAWAILAFLVLGGVRLYLDTVVINNHELVTTAIRDSAAVYYAIFFFVAYQVGKNSSARAFIERTMLAAFVLLIPIAALELWWGSLFDRFTYHGYPIIQHKGDLLTTYLGIAAFYFFLTPSKGIAKIFFRVCALASLILMLFPMSRAALFGFVCAALLLLVARRPQFLFYQLGVAFVALLAFALLQLSNVHFESELFKNLNDRVSSVVDISGTGHYQGDIGDSAAANNQFRTVWWTTVFNETMQKSPLFGLGFGYDLTAGFLRTYYANQNPDLTARSPHSILLTALGRMGVIGLASFVIILFLVVRMAFLAARSVARKRQPEKDLAPWCALINLLAAAMFGVVLEGPMGGILFWTLLGLAASQLISPKEERETESDVSIRRRRVPELAEANLVSRHRSDLIMARQRRASSLPETYPSDNAPGKFPDPLL